MQHGAFNYTAAKRCDRHGSVFRPSRLQQRGVVCAARPDSPYEPLEKAIRVINRVIALGERAKWGSSDEFTGSNGAGEGTGGSNGAAARERWVQFGAVYSSRLSVDQGSPAAAPASTSSTSGASQPPAAAAPPAEAGVNGAAPPPSAAATNGGGRRLLRDYLALPIDQYSLLDPKWISREEGGLFRFCLPLQDLVGVDMQPEIFISVLPEPQQQRVTLAGTRAALGSPEIDQAFKLNVNAVLSQRQRRRLPALLPRPPDHLPGRPVFRLRRWAAAARGRTWPPQAEGDPAALQSSADMSSAGSGSGSSGAPAEAEAAVAAAAAVAAGAAPFPSQHVYISHDGVDEEEVAELASADVAVAELALIELEDDPPPQQSPEQEAAATSASSNGSNGSLSSTDGGSAGAYQQQQQQPASPGGQQQAVLHCRTHVTMAVRVPGALKVVPNALLGYAGSLLLRTVLTATLPNFLDLLAADYRNWAGVASSGGGGGGEGGGRSRRLNAPVGDLFSDAAAAVQQGRERRLRQQQQADGSASSADEEQEQLHSTAPP